MMAATMTMSSTAVQVKCGTEKNSSIGYANRIRSVTSASTRAVRTSCTRTMCAPFMIAVTFVAAVPQSCTSVLAAVAIEQINDLRDVPTSNGYSILLNTV